MHSASSIPEWVSATKSDTALQDVPVQRAVGVATDRCLRLKRHRRREFDPTEAAEQ